ncbi:MAG: HTTM domain-containing protein [Candidatus Omnitrophica bacterium]|nr:HTTM domain-containing protein [Candidatus Omnitrophota bacterium]
MNIKAKLSEIFGLDLRSLALFRITLSILIILDLIVRAIYLRAHYTDFGLFPRVSLIGQSPNGISLHIMSGRVEWQAFLFILAGIFALMLLAGYRTWLATFFSWFLMVSLHNRNIRVLQGGDVLFHLLLFWSLFLPLGARCSVDRVLASSQEKEAGNNQKYFSSAGTFGLFAQIAMMYFFAVAQKLTPSAYSIWWKEGTAVRYALSLDQFTTPIGHALWHFPGLLKLFNYLTLLIEGLGPFLLFSPFWNGPIRLIGIILFILLQQGFNACLMLGPFPWVSTVSMLALLPAEFWDRLALNRRLMGWYQTLSHKLSQQIYRISQNQWIRKNILEVYPPSLTELKASKLGSVFALVCVVYILFWNLGNVSQYKIPRRWQWFGIALGIDQRWKMFSPPHRDHGWYVIPGTLKNGKQVDLFRNGAPVSWQKPENIAAMYPTERWRKYMSNLWASKGYRLDFGKYLCRDWNSRHSGEEQLDRFNIYFMKETTRKNFTFTKPEKVLLWNHYCFEVPSWTKPVSRDAGKKPAVFPLADGRKE